MSLVKYNPYYKAAMTAIPYMGSKAVVVRNKYRTRNVTSATHGLVNYSRPKRNAARKSLKVAVKDTQPAKHFAFETNQALLHNTIVTNVPTQGPIQGDSNIGRTGDSIYICALKVQGLFQSSAAANFYSMRLLVGWTGEEITGVGAASGFVSGLGLSEVFLPGTGGIVSTNGIVNPKAFTVLHDITIDSNSQIVTTVDGESFSFTVPINQSYYYQSAASAQGKFKNLVVVVAGFAAGGTTGTTAAGNIIMAADLIFKE